MNDTFFDFYLLQLAEGGGPWFTSCDSAFSHYFNLRYEQRVTTKVWRVQDDVRPEDVSEAFEARYCNWMHEYAERKEQEALERERDLDRLTFEERNSIRRPANGSEEYSLGGLQTYGDGRS